MSDTLSDTITPFFEGVELDAFKDKKFKKDLLDKIESDTQKNRKSIDITFNKILKTKLEDANIDPKAFISEKKKKFSSSLDLKTDTTKTETQEKFPSVQNPKGKLSTERKELPLGAVAGSVNSFLGAIFEDLEELTDTEKEDIGTCLNMAMGDYINAHDNARKVMGAVGVLGIYGGKIKTARSKSKKRKELKKQKEQPEQKELPHITKNDTVNFDKNSQEFIKDKIESDV